jgi:hypothetical protein
MLLTFNPTTKKFHGKSFVWVRIIFFRLKFGENEIVNEIARVVV